LREKSAAHDASHPFYNIIGYANDDAPHHEAAKCVLELLPHAPFVHLCTSTEAEFIKYAHNLNGYFQILLFNILFDAAGAQGARWEYIQTALRADPMISHIYLNPVHQSGHPGAKVGRGAGGHCFIKDFAAFREFYAQILPGDRKGLSVLQMLEQKNIELLRGSDKDADLLKNIYGDEIADTDTSS